MTRPGSTFSVVLKRLIPNTIHDIELRAKREVDNIRYVGLLN